MKRALLLLTVVFTVTISPIQSVQANTDNVAMQTDSEIAGMQRADVVVTKFRTYNNVLQYRRWNETRSCWVDPDWIDLG